MSSLRSVHETKGYPAFSSLPGRNSASPAWAQEPISARRAAAHNVLISRTTAGSYRDRRNFFARPRVGQSIVASALRKRAEFADDGRLHQLTPLGASLTSSRQRTHR